MAFKIIPTWYLRLACIKSKNKFLSRYTVSIKSRRIVILIEYALLKINIISRTLRSCWGGRACRWWIISKHIGNIKQNWNRLVNPKRIVLQSFWSKLIAAILAACYNVAMLNTALSQINLTPRIWCWVFIANLLIGITTRTCETYLFTAIIWYLISSWVKPYIYIIVIYKTSWVSKIYIIRVIHWDCFYFINKSNYIKFA